MSNICDDCKIPNTLVIDYKQGRWVCTRCGLVALTPVFDDRFGGRDHREFHEESAPTPRNQQADHAFMPPEYTLVSADTLQKGTTDCKRYARYKDAFKQLAMFGSRLSLTKYALNTAKRMFSKLRASRRNLVSVEAWLAAILYRASLIWKDYPHTLHWICRLMHLHGRDNLREVRRRVRTFDKVLPPSAFPEFTLVPEQQQVEAFVRAFVRKLRKPKWEKACLQQVNMYFTHVHPALTTNTPQLPEVIAAATLFRMYREARRRFPDATHVYDYHKLAIQLHIPEDTVRACEAKMPIMDPKQRAANQRVLRQATAKTESKKKR